MVELRKLGLLKAVCGGFIIGLLFVVAVEGFNVELRNPILKVGPPESLFGLSVAQHHMKANNQDADNAVLLVGAPTADSDTPNDGATKPGGLFRCPVSTDEKCTRVSIPTAISTLRANSSNQWLGISIKSHQPGGSIIVCAHRYTIRGGARNQIAWEAQVGRCFLLDNTIKPISNKLSYEWVPCLGRLDPNGAYSQEWFGYCQAGTAIDFADIPRTDGLSSGNEEFLVFGAPGSFFWSGSLYTSQSVPELFSVNVWSREAPDPRDDFSSPVGKNSLLGSSIATGVLLNSTSRAVNYASGAPGINVTGAVAIFEMETENKALTLKDMVYGDKIASRFGHEIKLIDVTGDGRLDLVVGAPQYFDREKNLGGAVYIYVNKDSGKMGPEPSQILFGKVDSTFGVSIANLGDINMDGADDIAVGAPGEDDWQGAVYIYHGNNQEGTMGVKEEPAQIIRSSELVEMGYISRNITGFGYSLSGALDMDFNGYPDFTAGSLSDATVMFLTRPIVNIVGSIKVPQKKIVIGERDENGYDITACLRYTSPSSFNDEVEATATLKLDTSRLDTDLLPRASFSFDDQSVSSKTLIMKLHPQNRNRDRCQKIKVFINKDFQDKLSPIIMSMEFANHEISRRRRRRASNVPLPTPIMNAAIGNTTIAMLEFSKDCGDDEICKSRLSFSAYYEVLHGKTEKSEKKWKSLEKNEDGVSVLKLGTEEQIGLMITVQNPYPGEDAHQAQLNIVLPDVVEYRSIDMIKSVTNCDTVDGNSTLVECTLGNPFVHDTVAQFRLKMSEKHSVIYTSTGFDIKLQLQTTSQQPGHDKVKSYPVIIHVEAQLNIVGYASNNQVPFSGEVIGQSAVKKADDAGVLLTHTYQVENTGTGPADNVELNVHWPLTLKNGKWLFYLLQVTVDNDEGNCSLPDDVNPLGLKYEPDSGDGRTKREADSEPDENDKIVLKEVSTKSPAHVYEELICPESATCIRFNCSLGSLQAKSTTYIRLHAILWNSTFLEEFPGVSQIKVSSSASISIAQKNIKYSDSSKLNDAVSIDILAEDITQPDVPLKWWIIAVAALAGLFLLVGIILLLWKCGFFKRRKFGDYQKARRHKQASKKAEERETLY